MTDPLDILREVRIPVSDAMRILSALKSKHPMSIDDFNALKKSRFDLATSLRKIDGAIEKLNIEENSPSDKGERNE